jgi:methyl-accepting chemotaxis protein
MATKKKIQASDVEVGNRTLEGVLADLADRIKDNGEQIKATAEEMRKNAKRYDEQNAVVLQEIRTIASSMFSLAAKMDKRLRALEKPAA